jgi:prepilin-type N-terminal cleavage/methylation domain-containing protein
MKNIKPKHSRSGFTLIEMTIVIVIASVIVAAALALARPYFAQQQIERTASAVRTVEQAMDDFLAENGRYPCPAPLMTPRGDALDGAEVCAEDLARGVFATDGVAYQGAVPATAVTDGILIGAVPYRALDIPVAATIDYASNRLTYVISAASTDRLTYDDALGGTGPDLISSAALEIVDSGNNSLSSRDIDGDGVDDPLSKHYFFFSHGQDGAGSYTDAGVANGTGCGGTFDSENCDLDGRFVAASRSLGAAVSYNDDVSNESLLIDQDLNDSLWARTPSDEDSIYNLNDENVGIGTGVISPAETRLHVRGAGADAQVTIERSDKKLWLDPNNNDADIWAQIAFDDGMGLQMVRRNENGPGPADDTWTSLINILNGGNIGIGTENPRGILHAVMPTNQPMIAEWFGTVGSPASGSHLRIMSNRGTETAPEQVRLNDALGILSFSSRGDSSGPNGHSASIIGIAAQNFTGTARGANLVFSTTALGQNGFPQERMRISSEGNVGVGITNPGRPLDVNRNIRIRSLTGVDWWTSLDLSHNTDTGHHPAVTGMRGRGTFEAPTGARPGDIIMSFDGRGTPAVVGPTPDPWFGTGIMVLATETHISGSMGSELLFRTTRNTRISSEVRGKITHDGNFKIGAGDPVAKLDVDGEIKISNTNLDARCLPAMEGSMRYNNDVGKKYVEFCDGNDWRPVGTGGSGNLEFYDCYESTQISNPGLKCPEPDMLVKTIWSNGGDWGGGGDRVTCCRARLAP